MLDLCRASLKTTLGDVGSLLKDLIYYYYYYYYKQNSAQDEKETATRLSLLPWH